MLLLCLGMLSIQGLAQAKALSTPATHKQPTVGTHMVFSFT